MANQIPPRPLADEQVSTNTNITEEGRDQPQLGPTKQTQQDVITQQPKEEYKDDQAAQLILNEEAYQDGVNVHEDLIAAIEDLRVEDKQKEDAPAPPDDDTSGIKKSAQQELNILHIFHEA